MTSSFSRLVSPILFLFLLSSFSFATETNLVKTAKLISCGYYLGSQAPECVADGDVSTYWSCGMLHNQWGEHWLVVDCGSLAEFTRFSIKHSAFTNLPGTENTQEFAVEIGPSLEGPWKEVYYVKNNAQENLNEFFFLPAMQSRFVRLHIIKPNYFGREDNFVRISEIEIWGNRLKSSLNFIASAQAATPDVVSPIPQTYSTVRKPYDFSESNGQSSITKAKATSPRKEPKVEQFNSSGKDYSSYIVYCVLGVGGIILFIC